MTTPTVELVKVTEVRPGDTLVSGSGLPVLPRACLVVDAFWTDDAGQLGPEGVGRLSLHILDCVSVEAGLDEIRERVFSYPPDAQLRRIRRGGEYR